MTRKKKPVCVTAAKGEIWFCDEGHLHVELADHNDNPIAEIHFSQEDGIEMLAGMVEDLGLLLVDPDDIEMDDDDEIGPVMGNA